MNTDPDDSPAGGPPLAPISGPVSPRHPRFLRILKWAVSTVAAGSVAMAGYIAVLVFTTPGVDELREVQATRASVILAADGEHGERAGGP